MRTPRIWAAGFLTASLLASPASAQWVVDTCTPGSVGQSCDFGAATCVPGNCSGVQSDGGAADPGCVLCQALPGASCPAASVGQACADGGVCQNCGWLNEMVVVPGSSMPASASAYFTCCEAPPPDGCVVNEVLPSYEAWICASTTDDGGRGDDDGGRGNDDGGSVSIGSPGYPSAYLSSHACSADMVGRPCDAGTCVPTQITDVTLSLGPARPPDSPAYLCEEVPGPYCLPETVGQPCEGGSVCESSGTRTVVLGLEDNPAAPQVTYELTSCVQTPYDGGGAGSSGNGTRSGVGTDTCTADSIGQPCSYGTCVPALCATERDDNGRFCQGPCVLCVALPGAYCSDSDMGQPCPGGGVCTSANGGTTTNVAPYSSAVYGWTWCGSASASGSSSGSGIGSYAGASSGGGQDTGYGYWHCGGSTSSGGSTSGGGSTSSGGSTSGGGSTSSGGGETGSASSSGGRGPGGGSNGGSGVGAASSGSGSGISGTVVASTDAGENDASVGAIGIPSGGQTTSTPDARATGEGDAPSGGHEIATGPGCSVSRSGTGGGPLGFVVCVGIGVTLWRRRKTSSPCDIRTSDG